MWHADRTEACAKMAWMKGVSKNGIQKALAEVAWMNGCKQTCLISEREARYLWTVCRHMSPHAADVAATLVARGCALYTVYASRA